jgi:hypothetical protein
MVSVLASSAVKIKCLWLRLRGTSEFKGSQTDVPAEHPLFLLNAACLAEKQHIPILIFSLFRYIFWILCCTGNKAFMKVYQCFIGPQILNLCCVLSGEATHTNFIVFGLIRSGLESTIYRTRGEHANHYTTDPRSTALEASTLTITPLIHDLPHSRRAH